METPPLDFDALIAAADRLRPAERRVARLIAAAPHEALVASAAALAAKAGVSDATVVRAAKALGFDGLDALRRRLAEALRDAPTPARRMTRTLQATETGHALDTVLETHQAALEALGASVTPALFERALDHLSAARRIAVFGLGPSGALAGYLVLQLRRFGLDAVALSEGGAQLADGLLRLGAGDLLLAMAYSPARPEAKAAFAEAERLGLPRLLLTDAPDHPLAPRADLVLAAPRGRAGGFSLHAATLAFLEALLVGLAARRPAETVDSLRRLQRLREAATGSAELK